MTTTEPTISGTAIALLTPANITTLAVLAAILLLRNKRARHRVYRTLRRMLAAVGLWLWARRLGIPLRLADRLTPKRWDGMTAARKLPGLARGKVRRTPTGIAINLRLTGWLTLAHVVANINQLETGLGLPAGTAQVKPSRRADRCALHITVRDPLAKPVTWAAPAGAVRLADPVRLAVTPHGDAVKVQVKNRIGIFGTSGSGKSCVQRLIGAHVVQAIDADLTVIDLKQGLESQHFEGKADRITEVSEAAAYVDWLLGTEFPRRADRMKQLKTSSWPESERDPARVVMVDEGNVLVRDFKADQLKRLFTAIEQGRALGVYFVWVTQFPKATNLPTELRSQLNVRICLRLESSQESELVFKDEAGQGWEPHKLRDHWLLIKSSKHRTPEESKAVWLDEKAFRAIEPRRPATAPAPAPAQPAAQPAPTVVLTKPTPTDQREQAARERPEPSIADRVWSLLAQAERPMGVREIARELGKDPATVQRAINRLTAAGQAAKDTDRKYTARLTTEETQP